MKAIKDFGEGEDDRYFRTYCASPWGHLCDDMQILMKFAEVNRHHNPAFAANIIDAAEWALARLEGDPPHWTAETENFHDDPNLACVKHKYLAVASLVKTAEIWRLKLQHEFLVPIAQTGRKFQANTGRGAGPVRVLITRVLPELEKTLQRKASSREVWSACKTQNQAQSIEFVELHGKPDHVFITGAPSQSFKRFGEIISQVRKPKNSA